MSDPDESHNSSDPNNASGQSSPLPPGIVSSFEPRDATRGAVVMEQQLVSLNVEPGNTRIQEKSRPITIANGDTPVHLVSNVFGIKLRKQQVFVVNVEAILYRDGVAVRDIFLGQNAYDQSDFGLYEMRSRNLKIMNGVFTKASRFFGSNEGYLYDMKHILYLAEPPASDTEDVFFTPEETFKLFERKMNLKVTLKKTPRSIELDASLFSQCEGALDLATRATDLTTILEIASSQYVASHPETFVMYNNSTFYFYNPMAFGYSPSSLPKLKSNMKYLGVGARKTCQLVEGPKGRGNASACLAIESKKTVFLDTASVHRTIIDIFFTENGRETVPIRFNADVTRQIKGFLTLKTVKMTHRNGAPIIIKNIGGSASDTVFNHDGYVVSVANYFSERYGKQLRYPYWPLVIDAKKNSYPMEVLVFTDCQRLRNKDLAEDDTAAMIRSSAKPPAEKVAEIPHTRAALNFENCSFMSSLGVGVVDKPLQLVGTTLAAPSVQYANNRNEQPDKSGRWRGNRYLIPVKLDNWAVVLIAKGTRRDDENNFFHYVERYIMECEKRGISVAQPPHTRVIYDTVESFFQECAGWPNKPTFIHFVDPDRTSQNHDVIKSMEQQHGIVTQCVRTATMIKSIGRGAQTFENIVNKTNVKNGGLNYCVIPRNTVFPARALFIGLAVNFSAGGFKKDENNRNPAIIGYAANDNANSGEYTGNFVVLRTPGNDGVDPLIGVVDEVVNRFVRNRQIAPSRLIVYRHGCDDGQFKSVLRYEVPTIQKVVKNIIGQDVPLTVIVPNKLHDVRLFKAQINPRDRADAQNVQPGLIVDESIVHPTFEEFYMVSHLALQGTARPTKYTVLHKDDADLAVDDLKRITNALCYDFQIVSSPVSKPAPAYIAEEYAKRGRNLFNHNGIDSSPTESDPNGSGESGRHVSTTFDRSSPLNFARCPFLRDKRINA